MAACGRQLTCAEKRRAPTHAACVLRVVARPHVQAKETARFRHTLDFYLVFFVCLFVFIFQIKVNCNHGREYYLE